LPADKEKIMGGLARPKGQQPPYEKLHPLEKAIVTGVKEVDLRRRKAARSSLQSPSPTVYNNKKKTTLG